MDLYKVVLIYCNRVGRNKNKCQSIDYGLWGGWGWWSCVCEVGSHVKLRKSTYLTCLVDAEGATLHTAVQLHNPGDFTGSTRV